MLVSERRRGARRTRRPFATQRSGPKTMTSRDVTTRHETCVWKTPDVATWSRSVVCGYIQIHYEWVHTLERLCVWMHHDVLGLV